MNSLIAAWPHWSRDPSSCTLPRCRTPEIASLESLASQPFQKAHTSKRHCGEGAAGSNASQTDHQPVQQPPSKSSKRGSKSQSNMLWRADGTWKQCSPCHWYNGFVPGMRLGLLSFCKNRTYVYNGPDLRGNPSGNVCLGTKQHAIVEVLGRKHTFSCNYSQPFIEWVYFARYAGWVAGVTLE